MEHFRRVGRVIFALAMAAFGFEYLLFALGNNPAPGAPWPAPAILWAGLAATVLLATAIAITARRNPRVAATILGSALLLCFLAVFLPALLKDPRNAGYWTSGFEIFAMAGAALALAGAGFASKPLLRFGEFAFAFSLAVFAVQHFLYAAFVASLIPAWIPGRLFLAWLTGAAMLAAGLAIATRIQGRLAANLTGLMFLIWFLVLHLPAIARAPHSVGEWTSAFVCLAVSGGALTLAQTSET